MILRPYQSEALEAIWAEITQNQTALCVMPTGSGKTELFMALLKKAIDIKPDFRAAILMGRIDLVTQTERRFKKSLGAGQVGVYCGSLLRRETSRSVTIASIQSADTNRFPKLHMIVVDEVHRFDQKNGGYLKFIENAQEKNPRLKLVGFTATPMRSDGVIYGDGKLFKKVCYRKTIKELIAIGHLCEPKMKGSDHSFDVSQLRIRAGEYRQEDIDTLVNDEAIILEQVKDALSRMPDRKSVFWAAANISHCNKIADTLMGLGERVTTVHSKLDKTTRDSNLNAFMSGQSRHVSFVSVLSEGFDHPPGDCLVLMRPTRSPVLYVQTAGRVLRPFPGKLDALILDYAQVVKNLGPLDDPYIKGKPSADGEAPVKECPTCNTYVFAGLRQCPECEHEFPAPKPAIEKLDKVADTTVKILSEAPKPETVIAGPAIIHMHQSKSGNQCVRILYQSDNIMYRRGLSGYSEYYVTTSPWAMERLERRLNDIGAELPGIPFGGEVEVPGSFEIIKTRDGKYDRILSVKRIAGPDTSFDFSANVGL